MDSEGDRIELGAATLDRAKNIDYPPADEYPHNAANINALLKDRTIEGGRLIRLGGSNGVDVFVEDDGTLVSWCGHSDELRNLYYKALQEQGFVEPWRAVPEIDNLRQSIDLAARKRNIDTVTHDYLEVVLEEATLPIFMNQVRRYSRHCLSSLQGTASSLKR